MVAWSGEGGGIASLGLLASKPTVIPSFAKSNQKRCLKNKQNEPNGYKRQEISGINAGRWSNCVHWCISEDSRTSSHE